VLAVEQDPAADARVPRQQPQQRHGQRRLAGPRLAGDPERRPAVERERHASHRAHLALGDAVRDGDVVQFQQAHAFAPRRRGLSTVSSARPHSVNARTTARMHRPGMRMYHQAPALAAFQSYEPRSMVPQEVLFAVTPRKASVDSVTMALATSSVVLASSSGATFGSTWRVVMCQWPAPSALERSMYGRASTASVCARIRRAVDGQEVTPIAMMMVNVLPPRMAASTSAVTSDGSTRNQSVIRMMAAPIQPLKCPAAMPSTVPMVTLTSAARKPMSSDVREPHHTMSRMERPDSSVPNG